MSYNSADNSAAGWNWAESHRFGAEFVQHPASTDEVRELVLSGGPVRALGSRHSFTDLADTSGRLISLDRLPLDLVIDSNASNASNTGTGNDTSASAQTASFAPGIRYGDLATLLQEQGLALHNLASLPHISVAGAVATGTHGSGDRNGNLATSVAAIEFIDATGELVRLARGDADFDGAVVALGALGIVTRITLDIQPTFDVRQDLYNDVPWDAVLGSFDAITSSAYSVSLFTNWIGDSVPIAWLKSRTDAPAPPETLFGVDRRLSDQHMIEGQPPTNATTQGGVPGPWNDRLAHFKLGFTPSNGDELQTEYLVPRRNVIPALEAMRELGPTIAPLLLVSELRSMTADRLWLSGAYDTDAVGVHFTWKKLPDEVGRVLPEIESRLLPLGARPHWGKVFAAGVDQLEPLYPRLDEFRGLAEKYDPGHLFRNEFLARKLGL